MPVGDSKLQNNKIIILSSWQKGFGVSQSMRWRNPLNQGARVLPTVELEFIKN